MTGSVVNSIALGKLEAILKISRENKGVDSSQNILEQTFAQVLPMTYQLLPSSFRQDLMTAYMASCQKTPYCSVIFQGLASFAQQEGWNEKIGIPYLSELIDLECLEIDVYLLPGQEINNCYPHGDLMQDVLFFNPDYRLKTYRYPVFTPSLLQGKVEPGHYDLLCFRSPKTKEVHLIPLSPFYRKVIESIVEQEITGKQAIQKAAAFFSISLTGKLYDEARGFFQSLFSKEAILGFQE